MMDLLNRLLIPFLIATATNSFAQANADEQTLQPCADANFKAKTSEGLPFYRQVEQLRECMIGKKFPSFSVTTTTGKKYASSDLADKVVLINSWFIGCAPCKAELPLLNELNQEFNEKGFLLLSFSTDDIESLTNFLKDNPITYPIVPSSKELLQQKLKTTYGYPTNIFINKKGEIVEYSSGGSLDEKGLQLTKEKFTKIILTELAK